MQKGRNAAREYAKDVEGVKDVNNEMTVTKKRLMTLPSPPRSR
jgi:osmotically-inducible protein OsmY